MYLSLCLPHLPPGQGKKTYSVECSCSHPLSPLIYNVLLLSPRAFRVLDHTYAHSHTCTPYLSQLQAGTCPRRTPTTPLQTPPPLPPTPIRTPRGRTPAPGGRAAHEPLAGPRSGREGAAQGSDGHSGRPIEPSTASPKGGSGSSDGPNERGDRVGLPPGIPLARIAGPWVTRKLGGRRRRQRHGSPVSDTGLQSPKPGQAAGPHPSPTVNAARGGVAWSPGPFVEGAPPLLVATK